MSKNSYLAIARCSLGAAVSLAFLAGCGDTPQLNDRESLGAADALWTAVTAKSLDLVNQSAEKIEKLHDRSSLSDDAFDVLSGVISTARTGEWPEARSALKQFVRGQRPPTRRS